MNFKFSVYQRFFEMLKGKIAAVQHDLDALARSAANETKSTAGDKHETALAMLQLEQENKRRQLKEWQAQQEVYQRIDPANRSKDVRLGSLVETDQGWFFVSVALGRTEVDGKMVFALSPTSPLGQLIAGATPGQELTMNDRLYKIISLQ